MAGSALRNPPLHKPASARRSRLNLHSIPKEDGRKQELRRGLGPIRQKFHRHLNCLAALQPWTASSIGSPEASGSKLLICGFQSRGLETIPGWGETPVFLYVLQSETTGKYYVGATAGLSVRMRQHQNPAENPGRYTRGSGPWKLVYSHKFPTLGEARRAERFVKRMKSRRFIAELIAGIKILPRFDKSE